MLKHFNLFPGEMTPSSDGPTFSSGNAEEMNKPTVEHKWTIAWHLVAVFSLIHLASVFGIYLLLTAPVKWQTIVFVIFLDIASVIGVTAGAHRLWTHRTYKAKLPLRMLLAFLFSMALQYSIFNWVENHRMHHKYSDTDADPHDSRRGFFFSHIGWEVVERHPEYQKKLKTIDLSDIYADPVARIQRKYYVPIAAVCCYCIPTAVPIMLWGESLLNSFFIAAVLRHLIVLHQTFCVNSVAHTWGYKPYNRHIYPVENNWVTCIALGEGFHNYHHTFPWDYSASELGFPYNLTTGFIDLMAWAGFAYDLKRASPESILEKKQKNI